MQSTKKEVGKRIYQIRRRLRLTQHEMATRLGVINRTISAYEQGDSYPSLSALIKLARIGGVSFDWLITGRNMVPEDIDTELTDEELELLKAYRLASKERRGLILDLAAALAEKTGG
jgi:transcriptional regulator with XRE-family HTH domain